MAALLCCRSPRSTAPRASARSAPWASRSRCSPCSRCCRRCSSIFGRAGVLAPAGVRLEHGCRTSATRAPTRRHGCWRRVGERVARARGGSGRPHDVPARAVAAASLKLDTGLTSGNSFRGEVESVRGLGAARRSTSRPAPTRRPTVVIPDPADVEPVAAAARARPGGGGRRRPGRGPAGHEGRHPAQAPTRTRPRRSTQMPGLREAAKEAGGDGRAGRRPDGRGATTCASRRRATTG